MTCIAGLVHGDTVWIGADSAGVAGWSLTVRADAKVFRNGPFVMGFTSSFRMGQLLCWSFTPPVHPNGIATERFMVTTFIDAIRECFKKGGYLKKENEQESGGSFLVGYRGELWAVEADYQVGRAADGFAAVGCGAEIALGSLFSTASMRSPRRRILKALEAAERLSAGVRGPFMVLKC